MDPFEKYYGLGLRSDFEEAESALYEKYRVGSLISENSSGLTLARCSSGSVEYEYCFEMFYEEALGQQYIVFAELRIERVENKEVTYVQYGFPEDVIEEGRRIAFEYMEAVSDPNRSLEGKQAMVYKIVDVLRAAPLYKIGMEDGGKALRVLLGDAAEYDFGCHHGLWMARKGFDILVALPSMPAE